jgi:hypothetical protein
LEEPRQSVYRIKLSRNEFDASGNVLGDRNGAGGWRNFAKTLWHMHLRDLSLSFVDWPGVKATASGDRFESGRMDRRRQRLAGIDQILAAGGVVGGASMSQVHMDPA